MDCNRCGGTMRTEPCYGEMLGSIMFKCILCGERVDDVVISNRTNPLPISKASPLMAGSRSRIKKRHECICGCGVLVTSVYATTECRVKTSMSKVESKCSIPEQEHRPDFPSDFYISENIVGISESRIR